MTSLLTDAAERARATDVTRSVIVQAPAGSGKTTLLVTRYLALLAVVAQPEEILAITFTRKAAAEMRARVQQALARGAPEAAGALARSATLGWELHEQPGRLRIQTIDAFALSLVRRLPIGAGFDPAATPLESARALYEHAAERVLMRLHDEDPLADAVADFVARCDNDQRKALRLLADMLGRREQWLEIVNAVVAADRDEPERVAAVLEAGIEELRRSCTADFESALAVAERESVDALVAHAAHTLGVDGNDPAVRYRLVAEIFTTRRGEWRRQVDRRQGLLAGDHAEKRRIRELMEAFESRGLRARLAQLRHLPVASIDSKAQRALLDVCVNLALANAELAALFDAQRVVDFNALTLGARAALGEALAPSELALALDAQISHLLVDEFQDTSVAQLRLFEQLVAGWTPGDGRSFFAVGDPMQSIYRFRDADVSLFLRAWEHGIGGLPLSRVELASNFRSDAALVEWFNLAFSRILGTESDPVVGRIRHARSQAVRPVGSTSFPVRVTGAASMAAQTAAIVARIEALLASDTGNVAVLVRSRTHLETLLPALRARSIEWHASDIEPLIDKPAVTDLLTLHRALGNPNDRLAWFSLLRAPWVGLSLSDLQFFADVQRIPDRLAEPPEGLSAAGRARLSHLAAALGAVLPQRDEQPPRSILEAVWSRMDATHAYDDPLAMHHADRLLELIDGLGGRGFDTAHVVRSAEALFASDLNRGRLEIMTIHRAKGLEFDHVILPYLERTTAQSEREALLWRALPEGLLIGVPGDDAAYDWLLRESRARERHEIERLFYVACTRAKRTIDLFACEPDGRPATGSLLELLGRVGPHPAAETPAVEVRDRAASEAYATREGLRPPPVVRYRRLRERARKPQASLGTSLRALAAPAIARPLARVVCPPMDAALDALIRHALAELAERGLPDSLAAHCEQREGGWRHLLVDAGIAPELHDAALAELHRQLEAISTHSAGRWLLGAREQARSAVRLTGRVESRLLEVTLDRTFVDAGNRWVIEYHAAPPAAGESREAFVDRCMRALGERIDLKSRIAAARFGGPVKASVYFTALPHLGESRPAG